MVYSVYISCVISESLTTLFTLTTRGVNVIAAERHEPRAISSIGVSALVLT